MADATRIACVQMAPRIGETARDVARSLDLVAQAARASARLVVLPELANTGCVFETRAEAFALAEPVPDGPTVAARAEAAAAHGLWLVAGIAERAGDRLYNAAVLIGPDGLVGRYRKAHLWAEEALFFEPGDLGFPVFATRLGRIGMAVCYDVWFPEAFRTMAVAGADDVCVPTNWVPWSGHDPGREAMANLLVTAAAHCNGLVVAAADRVGEERGQAFIGRSLIAGPAGWPVGGPVSADREELVLADVDLAAGRRMRSLNAFDHLLRDRRPDPYGGAAGARATGAGS